MLSRNSTTRFGSVSLLDMVISDISSMRSAVQVLYESMPDPSIDLLPWLRIAQDKPATWNTHVRNYQSIIRYARFPHASGSADVPSGPIDPHVCIYCDKESPSNAALFSHSRHEHGYINPIRLRIISTACEVCFAEFHTCSRLLKHVQSSSCKSSYLDFPIPADEDRLAFWMSHNDRPSDKTILPPCIAFRPPS